MSAPVAEQRYFGVASAAHAYDSSPTIIRELIRDNRLPAKKLGSKVLISATDLDAFFASLPDA